MKSISYYIEELLNYGLTKKLFKKEDTVYIRNRILEILNIKYYEEHSYLFSHIKYPSDILDKIVKYAINNEIIEDMSFERLNLKAKLMDILIDKPSEVNRYFYDLYKKDRNKAFSWLYQFSKDSNYIQMEKIDKNIHYKIPSNYGQIQISINLSKPEKSLKEIEMLKYISNDKKYPKSPISFTNEGNFGTVNREARQNLRIIHLNLNNKEWGFQYSPYIYYNEHSIVFSKNITPMKIEKETFENLLDFLDFCPEYFIGSNSEIPVVGGSILNHEHYQAGKHIFPIQVAKVLDTVTFKNFPNITGNLLKWPLTTIRLEANKENKKELIECATKILKVWRSYSDVENNVISHTDGEYHNTITPIARINNEKYELDLILRNNRKDEKNPYGIFHVPEKYHNIKKENIGLIEAMGLAILPARLKVEMEEINQILRASITLEDTLSIMKENEELSKHINFLEEYFDQEMMQNDYIKDLYRYIGNVFVKSIEQCGVFKLDEKGTKGLYKFLNEVNR